jgi:hypothetical protein
MVRFKQCFAVAVVALVGAVAHAQQSQDGDASAAKTERRQQSGAVTPDLVVDVNQLAARAPDPVICRDVLKQGSNTHVIYCLTRADWRRYKRIEADEAEDFVRALQGGTYGIIYR